MEPNATQRDVQSSGVSAEGTFGISVEDTAHIMGILRDSMYTDRVMAVLREYASNAWDANREAGKGDTPIRIHVPTNGEPTLTIRDDGPGLSEKDVFTIYTQYGRSTKRGSNVAVGMLGVGSKSAFAYSDQFTVTSWHGGMKRVYVASLDESDLGIMQRLHEEPCDPKETGVEIKVAVRPEDVWEFQRKATSLYSNFRPRPSINIHLRPEQEVDAQLDSGLIFEDDGDWVALMGCVPYRVNVEQLRGLEDADALWICLHRMSGVLYFNIGEVEIAASREELKYTKKTKAALLEAFEKLIDEYVTHTLKALKNDKLTPWNKRLRLQGLNKLGLPLPDSARKWAADAVPLYTADKIPQTFTVIRENTAVSKIGISPNTRFFVKDDGRQLKGYSLGNQDYVVKPLGGADIKAVRAELTKVLKAAKLSGISVADISTLPWHQHRADRGQRNHNVKHKVSSFRLINWHNYGILSSNWEVVDRTPTEDDVFVVINRFEAVGFSSFYRIYEDDRALAKVLGLTMPEVYGYKTTERKPVTEEDCEGTTYREWRKDFFANRMTPTLWRYLSFQTWARALDDRWGDRFHGPFRQCRDKQGNFDRWVAAQTAQEHLETLLGADHPIVQVFVKHVRGVKAISNATPELRETLGALREHYGDPKTCTADQDVQELNQRYPLLDRYTDISALWTEDSRWGTVSWNTAREWANYIKMVDAKLEAEAKDENEAQAA